MRRATMLAIVGSVLLVAFAGVAWAANIQCLGGRISPCVGTEENDRITGSQLDDHDIEALGGRDEVTARGGDDVVDGGAGRDEITGGAGGDLLLGGRGPDEIGGGQGTPDGTPWTTFGCTISDPSTGTGGYQFVSGDEGNDDLDGGRDNDFLQGADGADDLSGNGGGDCLNLIDLVPGNEPDRVSGGDGDDLVFAGDGYGDDIFCGAGHDTVRADAEDRVAADCEDVIRPTPLQEAGATPVGEVTITTPEGTITMTPQEIGSL